MLPVSTFAKVCEIAVGFENIVCVNKIRMQTCRKMFALPCKGVFLVTLSTVKAQPCFKLRGSLIRRLP